MIGAALCIVVGATLVELSAEHFTLRWEHTVEKTAWEEDYEVVGRWLYLRRARVQGSGAGMEPPSNAVKIGSAWEYRPKGPWRREVVLARSGFGRDYELCVSGACKPLSAWAPAPVAPTTLSACVASGSTLR